MLLTPDRITLGRVLSVHPEAGNYLVNVGTGLVEALYAGVDRGVGGVAESGCIVPGTYVWVLFPYDLTQAQAVIVAALLPAGLPDAAQYGFPALHPQQSGPGGIEDLAEQLAQSEKANTPAQTSQKTLPDLGVGEWGMSSPLGAGVAVEYFRAWLAAGPWNGTWHDLAKRLTKHAAWNESTQRFCSSEDSRQRGTLSHETRRVFFDENASQRTLLAGYREDAGGVARGVRWQMLSADGGYELASQRVTDDGVIVLSSARGLVFEKRLYAPMTPLTDVPMTDGLGVAEAAKDSPSPLTYADARVALLRVFDLGDRSRASDEHVLRRLVDEWQTGTQISEKVPASETMWGSLPPVRTIKTALGEDATYYLGRSAFGILPDGSIEFVDATGATILLGGGNGIISVPGTLCIQAGKDVSLIAGRNLSLLAHDNLQAVSDQGSVYVKAEKQMNLLGGNSGAGGVVIESRSNASGWAAGDGDEFTSGGILLKSPSDVTVASATVNIRATSLYERIEQGVYVEARGSIVYNTPTFVGINGETLAWSVTASTAYLAPPLLSTSLTVQHDSAVLGSATFGSSVQVNGQVAHRGDATITGKAAKRLTAAIDDTKEATVTALEALQSAVVDTVLTVVNFLNQLPVFNETLQLLGVSLPGSKQLGTDQNQFVLPAVHWQLRTGGTPWSPTAVVSPAGNNAQSLPFPGVEVWQGESLVPRVESAYFSTADVTSSHDSYQPEPLSLAELIPMYGNLIRSL